ncbi:hypothetical protein TNIN_41821 [Trichonephila inaurata madagascariensis]|uniref:Uncharacterized protein n=1 Tax=Trichonephila inaurata madagascariensis TaxID=2747483 RepID=A0A8X7CRJ1_9ARAC|nr:hypothetical protein TNIN_41821 [Trichonephila inaurata madagascariensis]
MLLEAILNNLSLADSDIIVLDYSSSTGEERIYRWDTEDKETELSTTEIPPKKMERTILNWRQDEQHSPKSGRPDFHQFPGTLRTLYSSLPPLTAKLMFFSPHQKLIPCGEEKEYNVWGKIKDPRSLVVSLLLSSKSIE